MTNPKTTQSNAPRGGHVPKVVAKAEGAAKTNKNSGSLVRCDVKIEKGDWISPDSCAVCKIDADGKFPEICYEIRTESEGPFEWSWELKWIARACPQRRDKPRFTPRRQRTFFERGHFTSVSKKWTANLNEKSIGGELTVRVKAGANTFVRKTIIEGAEPGEEKILEELASFRLQYPDEVELAKKIFRQESKFCHFFSDNQPLMSFDNGYGLGQATEPAPTFEQVWNWKEHVKYIVTVVIKEKRSAAKKYLDKYGGYTKDDLDTETLVYYNGANYHYLVWDSTQKKWQENKDILCDSEQSNSGWDIKKAANKEKSLTQLRNGEGGNPVYTGRCYAEHIKNSQR
jgi:hypothetical protein